MTLDELIAALQDADPAIVCPVGFNNPHSYRGYYDELAFEPALNTTVGDMLAAARSALGTTYQGWKGGDYEMTGSTDCWLSVEGSAAGETLGPTLIKLLLGEQRVLPRRGDAVEAWLKQQRDEHGWNGTNDRPAFDLLDHLLDEYRLHADTGTPLHEHVCPPGPGDDCAGCYDAQDGASA